MSANSWSSHYQLRLKGLDHRSFKLFESDGNAGAELRVLRRSTTAQLLPDGTREPGPLSSGDPGSAETGLTDADILKISAVIHDEAPRYT